MFFKIILFFFGAVCISAEIFPGGYNFCLSFGCFNSGDTQLYMTLDDEDEVFYADFKNELLVWNSRIPSIFHVTWAYDIIKHYQVTCKNEHGIWKLDKSARKTHDPPDIVIYTKDEVMKEKENTLICFVNNFFPPVIQIRWTKNEEEVKVKHPLIKSVPNSDGTLHVFSYLNFDPNEGDIYGCTVEHEALDEPKTRLWKVELDEMSNPPAVFCGIGLTFGLIGVAIGTFFFVKGQQHHDTCNFDVNK